MDEKGQHVQNAVMHIDFYYDIVCPYAYLGSTQIEAVAKRCGVEVRWHPVLLGGIFRSVGGAQSPMNQMSAPRARLNALDLQRWADIWGVPLKFPDHHPRRTVATMRLLTGTEPSERPALSKRLYEAYWQEGLDLADRSVLESVAREAGADPSLIDCPSARQGLFDTTAEAVAHGAFGVPAMVVDGSLWWGQDRLHFVEAALGGRWPALPGAVASTSGKVRFYHDFASPFSYLAATQIEQVCASHGAELEWCPILLGGLFRSIGTADVPLFEMSEAKRAYVSRDLHDWAGWWAEPFNFPSHFPMRTVLALRAAIVEPSLTMPIYRAAWSEDRPIDDPEVLGALIDDQGFDARDVLARTQSADVKGALRANTERAQAAGACGVPTFEVTTTEMAAPLLLWGQDRIPMLERALQGWMPPCG